MSYKITEVAAYGVKVTVEEARRIYIELWTSFAKQFEIVPEFEPENFSNQKDFEDYLFEYIDQEGFHGRYIDDLYETKGISLLEENPNRYGGENSLQVRWRYFPELFAMDGDSRSKYGHWYNKKCEHVFGVYLASNGYAYEDDMKEHTHPISEDAIAQYEIHCRPVLEKLQLLKGNPSLHIFSQTW